MAARPRDAASGSRPASGTPTRTRSSSTTCRTTSPRRTTWPPSIPEKVAELQEAVLGGGREVPRHAAARRARRLLRDPAAARASRRTFTYYGDVQNVASGMIPRIYNHSYTISADLEIPDGGAEGVIVAEADHLGGFSLFVAGRQAQAHLLVPGRARVSGRSPTAPLPTGERQRADGVRRRRAQAGHGRRGDAVRQRRAGRRRPDGAHRAVRASPATRAWTSAATTACRSTAATPTSRRSRSPARSRRSSSTSTRTSTDERRAGPARARPAGASPAHAINA